MFNKIIALAVMTAIKRSAQMSLMDAQLLCSSVWWSKRQEVRYCLILLG